MLALTDSDAVVVEAASRLASGADRARLLPAAAEKRSRAARRSPAAEKQRRYRANLRRGVAYVPLPVTPLIVDYLVRGGLLPRDREAVDRVEIGLAAAAALERAARADR